MRSAKNCDSELSVEWYKLLLRRKSGRKVARHGQ